jgi:hypothetical protein
VPNHSGLGPDWKGPPDDLEEKVDLRSKSMNEKLKPQRQELLVEIKAALK